MIQTSTVAAGCKKSRHSRRRLAVGGLLSAWLLLAAAPARADLPAVIEAVRPSVVAIGTFQRLRRPPARFLGTGFVVGDGHHVLTNLHVVTVEVDAEGREQLTVFVGRGKAAARAARIVADDAVHDLALLRIEGAALPTLRLGDSSQVREGELYAFTGFPIGVVLGLYPATHRGIVAAVTPIAIPQLSPRSLDPKLIKKLRDPYDVFQLDATAYPGNSGSPLYDPDSGAVVGVINKVFVKESKENVLERPSGITYAIPIRHAYPLLRSVGLDGS